MYSLATVIVISIITFIIGAAGGVVLYRQFGRQSKITQNLEQRLQQAEQQFTDYQSDVTEHFAETSRRVNTLTQNYKDVHEYLASSAMKLTNPQMSRSIAKAAQQNLPHQKDISQHDNGDEDQPQQESIAEHRAQNDSDPEELTTASTQQQESFDDEKDSVPEKV